MEFHMHIEKVRKVPHAHIVEWSLQSFRKMIPADVKAS